MAVVIKMPKMSDTMTEGVIADWQKKVGDQVKSGDILAEVETDKATMDLENFDDGTLLYIGPKAGEAVPVDAVIAIVGKPGEDITALLGGSSPAPSAPPEAKAPEAKAPEAIKAAASAPQAETAPPAETPAPTAQPATPEAHDDERLKASPLARTIAQEKGINLKALQGSGDGGRIIKRDVLEAKPALAENNICSTCVNASPNTRSSNSGRL